MAAVQHPKASGSIGITWKNGGTSVGPPVTTQSKGNKPANYQTIFNYLQANGYSFNAAAGICGNMFRESHGNPESVGTGGGGLIGFTPLPSNMVTGKPTKDLLTQLKDVLAYNNKNFPQLRAALNKQKSPGAAAAYYMNNYENPAPATAALGERMAAAQAVAKAMR